MLNRTTGRYTPDSTVYTIQLTSVGLAHTRSKLAVARELNYVLRHFLRWQRSCR